VTFSCALVNDSPSISVARKRQLFIAAPSRA